MIPYRPTAESFIDETNKKPAKPCAVRV
jgi:hypothetical protein